MADEPLRAVLPARPDPPPAPKTRSHRDRLPQLPRWLIISAALLAAAVVGRFMADGHMKYAFAVVIAACYVPLVFFDLAAALAVWLTVLFFQDLSLLSFAPNALGVLVALGWLGAYVGRRKKMLAVRQHRRLFLWITLLGFWLTLTIAWSQTPGDAATEAGYWWLGALAFLIITTSINSARGVKLIALAFVAGSLISVVIGLATGSLQASNSAATAIQGRFTGGTGDPNVAAAGFVASMFLLIGLFSVYRKRSSRIWLMAAFILVTVGFLATQSRGGLFALLVASGAAMVLSPRQRKRILGLVSVAAVAVGVLLAIRPDALARIVDFGGGSSGRSDLWTVAWRVFTSHPVVGVGIGNFQLVESHYVLVPGSINRIQYLTDVPHLVHNSYLQLLAESGVVGLALFLIVVFGCLRAFRLAIQRFEARRRGDYADLTRAMMMGTIGMLTALFFISDGDDLRLWVMLALGPTLLTLASRASHQPKTEVVPRPAAPVARPSSRPTWRP